MGKLKIILKKFLAGRTPGINLTEEGKKQAEQAGEMIKSLNISAIYSSPIDRAMQTAEIVGKHCDVKPISDDRLIELDMGKVYDGSHTMKSSKNTVTYS